MYYWIEGGEDGIFVFQYTRKTLLKHLKGEERIKPTNEYYRFVSPEELKEKQIYDILMHYEERNLKPILLIKGEVVLPEPKVVVKEYDVE